MIRSHALAALYGAPGLPLPEGVEDTRVGLQKPFNWKTGGADDLVDLIIYLRQNKHGKPGPVGVPGSRTKRQPWNQGKRRNGARVQASRVRPPSRREVSLREEWESFVNTKSKGLVRYERKGW